MKNYDYTKRLNEIQDLMQNKGYILLSGIEACSTTSKPIIRYICPKHESQGEQKISLGHLRLGQGCRYCGREIVENAHKENLELNKQFYEDLCKEKNFELVNLRRDKRGIIIDFICNDHRDLGIQTVTKANLIRNQKCQYCRGKNLPEDYVLKKIHEVNPNLKILSKYHSFSGKLTCQCTKHGVITSKKPYDIIKLNQGCDLCGREKLSSIKIIDDNNVIKRIHKINPHVDLIEYNGRGKLGKFYCNIHKKTFTKTPTQLFNHKSGCDECYAASIRINHGIGQEQFESRLKARFPQLKVIGTYINNSTPIELYCTEHDYSFCLAPSNILTRFNCCLKSKSRYKEESVCNLLEEWGFNIQRQKKFVDCIDKAPLSFDIYLADYKLAIEYQGERHYYPVRYSSVQTKNDLIDKYEYTIRHDEIKRQYCKSHNIKLIEIPYWEYDDLEYYLFDKLVKSKVIIEE